MADTAADVGPTAAASKKKYRNKKKSQQRQHQSQKSSSELPQEASAAHQPNGHVEGDANDANVALINGLVQQEQLCNGHAKENANNAQITPTVNGHANKSTSVNNNNHINDNNNKTSSNSTNSNNNNNANSIISSNCRHKNNTNNNSHNSTNLAHSTTAKTNNNKTYEPRSNEEAKCKDQKQQTTDPTTLVATTSKSTAKTETISSTTKTTPMATVAARFNVHNEAPSTSAAAAAAAAVAATVTEEAVDAAAAMLQKQLLLEPAISADEIVYKEYEAEHQMHDIMRLIQAELSEPYSIYTYRYFIYNWPKLCFLASHDNQYVGAIVCKLDMHMSVRRGYIAMLAVRKEYRKLKIGTRLVTKAIKAMLADNADEVVLETEMRNEPALRLYENLGFVRDKRLFRYYLNGVDALRLKLWFR